MPEKGYEKFDPANLEVISYLVGSPDCKFCWGKGYTGITVQGVVIRCRCAIVKEPMTAKIVNNQVQLGKDLFSVQEHLEKTFDDRWVQVFDLVRLARNETREEFEKINNRRWVTRLRKLFRRKQRGHLSAK